MDEYKQLIPLYQKTEGNVTKAASILGLHLEGPYFSLNKIGAHPLGNIKTPNQHSISEMYGHDLSNVKIVTLAPELDGSIEAIKYLKESDPERVVSIGHSSATLADAEEGIRAGATLITHLFNAMAPFHHREPGIVGVLGLPNSTKENVYFGMIVDGIHSHPSVVSMAYHCFPANFVLVTDSMMGLGLPVGKHTLGAQQIDITKT